MKRRVRVCVVSPYSPTAIGFGGIASSTGYYLRALAQADFAVAFVASSSSMGGETSAEELEAQYPGVSARLYRAEISARWGVGLGLFACLRPIAAADVVMLHGTRAASTLLAGLICRAIRKPYLVVPHAGLDVSRLARTRRNRPVLSAILMWPTMAVVNGAKALVLSGDLEHRTLIPAAGRKQWRQVENFFHFDTSRLDPGEFIRPTRYLFAGRIESDKGILAFAKVWVETAPSESRLVIVGSGAGEYHDQLLRLANSDSRIELRGEVAGAEVAALMRSASIIVLPTGMDEPVTENFGNVVVEGLIAGRPAMVTTGLHWDEYADNPALVSFAPTAEGAAEAIRQFETVGSAAYGKMTRAAVTLARRFHLDAAVPKLRDIVEESRSPREL